MKKFALLLIALFLLSLIMTNAALAVSYSPPENYSRYCKMLKEDYPVWFDENWDSHGDCVSSQLLQHITWCEEIISNPAYGYKNIGQCIKVEMQPWK